MLPLLISFFTSSTENPPMFSLSECDVTRAEENSCREEKQNSEQLDFMSFLLNLKYLSDSFGFVYLFIYFSSRRTSWLIFRHTELTIELVSTRVQQK